MGFAVNLHTHVNLFIGDVTLVCHVGSFFSVKMVAFRSRAGVSQNKKEYLLLSVLVQERL